MLMVVGAFIFGGLTVARAQPAAPLDAGETSFSVQSAPGDFVGAGQTLGYTTANATIAVVGTQGALTMNVSVGLGSEWTVNLAPPTGGQLTPGLYDDAQRWPFNDLGHAGLSVYGQGRGCNNLFGSFLIKAISADAYGRITLLDATFTQHCETVGAPALTGVVKFHAPPTAPVRLTAVNPVTVRGEPALFTAEVGAGASGAAVFLDGGAFLGAATVDENGFANLTETTLAVGDHAITASFGGQMSSVATQQVRDDSTSFWFFAGALGSYVAPPDTMTVQSNASKVELDFREANSSHHWHITFGPPPGQTLHTGAYFDAERWPFQSAGHGGLDVVQDSFGCNEVTGSFDISEIATDALGLRSFAATFTHHCESPSRQPLLGTVRYHRGTVVQKTLHLSATSLSFGNQKIGTASASRRVTLRNTGNVSVGLDTIKLVGASARSFNGQTSCFGFGAHSLAPGHTCYVDVRTNPGMLGSVGARLQITDHADGAPHFVTLSARGVEGYMLGRAQGSVARFGAAPAGGDASTFGRTAPIAAIATTPTGSGYWLLGRDGGVFAFGKAGYFGSLGGQHLGKPIVAMAATHDGRGYWLVAPDGDVFPFGTAPKFGSLKGVPLVKPIVGITVAPDGQGYWLVASDGNVFAFGTAPYFGSLAGAHLNRPIIALRAATDGNGYWLVASDGGVFRFGNAKYFGSAAGIGATIVGMDVAPDGNGYWLVSRRGRVFNFGSAPHYGEIRAPAIDDVIGITATSPVQSSSFRGVILILG